MRACFFWAVWDSVSGSLSTCRCRMVLRRMCGTVFEVDATNATLGDWFGFIILAVIFVVVIIVVVIIVVVIIVVVIIVVVIKMMKNIS